MEQRLFGSRPASIHRRDLLSCLWAVDYGGGERDAAAGVVEDLPPPPRWLHPGAGSEGSGQEGGRAKGRRTQGTVARGWERHALLFVPNWKHTPKIFRVFTEKCSICLYICISLTDKLANLDHRLIAKSTDESCVALWQISSISVNPIPLKQLLLPSTFICRILLRPWMSSLYQRKMICVLSWWRVTGVSWWQLRRISRSKETLYRTAYLSAL